MDPLLILAVGMAVVVGGILALRLHAFLALVLGALAVAMLTPSEHIRRYAESKDMAAPAAQELAATPAAERVAAAFGRTAGKIGILIAMAAIIGKCMLDSGAADRVVRAAVRLFGAGRAPIAFAVSGFTLGIPVFFDTVFYLMIPLGKALAARTGRDYALYVMTIAAGTTIAHSLVPPTPGPLLVAAELDINLGTMMLTGLLLGIVSVIPGCLYAFWANRRWPIPLRESADVSLAELRALAERDEKSLPPLWLSLLPIALPIALITGSVLVQGAFAADSALAGVIGFVGNKNVALILSAAVALGTTLAYKRDSKTFLTTGVQSALASGGVIILITAAGGAFGEVLQQTDVGDRIAEIAAAEEIGLLMLPLAFLVTALVRTAQGSATVAMITTVGMFAGFAREPTQLGFHPVYLAAAIGFGSKPFSWMNDSGFWIVCKLSGQTEAETLRNHSTMLTIMGLAGVVVTMLAAAVLPMMAE